MIAILILLYRATLDKLVERGILLGRGGIGEDRVIDLSAAAVLHGL